MVRIPSKARGESQRAAALLGRRIRAAGLSQREVAQALGVSLSHLNKVLSGRHALKIERLYAALAALGIEPVDFFTELHGPAASFPAFHLSLEDEAGGRPVINVFLFAEQMLAKEERASRREARQRRREAGGTEGAATEGQGNPAGKVMKASPKEAAPPTENGGSLSSMAGKPTAGGGDG
jgi:transcriptional regulator with XRE-family HTH domain